MRKSFFLVNLFIFFFIVTVSHAQQIKFTQVIKDNLMGTISSVTQDRQGYIWFAAGTNASTIGLYRYDGVTTMAFRHEAGNANSPAGNAISGIAADSSGIIWTGTFGAGLDRYDPSSNTFTHFKHDNKNSYSLANDSVTALLVDHNGDLWAGTLGGLDKLDKKTGRFIHFKNRPNDTTSLSADHVGIIYEDRERIIWVGCGFVLGLNEPIEYGGLNRFNAARQNFTRYLHDPSDPKSIANNKVKSLMEDSKGNFWVGTNGDGLHIMNRKQGTFTHYYYDAAHPEKLSRPPLDKGNSFDYVTFIKEDLTGAIWIGSLLQGANRYDPITQKIAHYGFLTKNLAPISAKDTASGLNSMYCWSAFISKDGLLWISTIDGNLYTVNPLKTTIPYYNLNVAGNSFYKEAGTNVLWIATGNGLVREDLSSGTKKVWRHEPLNSNSLCNDTIPVMRVDATGNFWLPTKNGLSKFDPATDNFTTYRHSVNDTNSLSSNNLDNAYIDHNKNIWLATGDSGLDKLDVATNTFTHFKINSGLANSQIDNYIICIDEDREHNIWFGTYNGIKRLNNRNLYAGNYLAGTQIVAMYADAKGSIWAGSAGNLYRYDSAADNFLPFMNPFSKTPVRGILHIMEDGDHNLWVATASSIIKINESRNTVIEYGTNYGVHKNAFVFADNFKAGDGQLFFGDKEGYYAFYPDKLKETNVPPVVNFTAFKLEGKEMLNDAGNVLQAPLWETKEIKLSYDQNVFSFDFMAPYFTNPGVLNYAYKLENYDNEWHSTGTERTARFFSVPPGTYILHVRAAMDDGLSGETSMSIIILPPWWATWWFRILSVIVVIIVIYAIIKERSKKLMAENLRLEQRVTERTAQLERSLKDLKSTQSQLIQSEKMASLGELTAGIAHEIQNPLNFVNNFSEVNQELIEELQGERAKVRSERDEALENEILNDIKANEEKINHHGKRADAIVKGMLQHSRKSEGKKEPTDINALCDEYLRLAYHGLRAKDKSFNTDFKTDFDESINKINIIPQDIGRVLLNLYNNAFYAVKPPNLLKGEQYKPLVSVTTRKINSPLGAGGIEIKVADNGNGIPQNIVDKIFQPFFTTKPTGQGTGLGLSLSYDIIKAHGGKIKVNTKEGEGSEFIIQLPV